MPKARTYGLIAAALAGPLLAGGGYLAWVWRHAEQEKQIMALAGLWIRDALSRGLSDPEKVPP